jgi:HK97 family phage portal protein
VPLLDAGMKYYPLKLNPQDAQYIESRKFTELDIARIFGVPPHMIGILDRATWNNVEALGIEFAKYTMLPICVNWEQELDIKLLKEADKDTIYTRFNLEGIMRADMKTRYESYKLGIQNGFMSINEARALENRNPVEGGDKHFVQGNNMVDINEINGLIDNNND